MRAKHLYFKKMYERDRLLLFTIDNIVVGGLTYVFTNNPESIARQDIWSIPCEDFDGKYIYIDRLTTDRKSSLLDGLKVLCGALSLKYPNKKIVWHSRRTGKLKEIGNEVNYQSSKF